MRDELSHTEVLRIAAYAERLDEAAGSEATGEIRPLVTISSPKRTSAIRKRILEPARAAMLLNGASWLALVLF